MTTDREQIIAAANEAGCAHANLLYDIAENIEELRTLAFEAGAASRDAEIAELVAALEAIEGGDGAEWMSACASEALAKVRKPT